MAMSNKPNPILLSINICDQIIRDEITKKISLIGLFNAISARNFPTTHALMHIYVSLTDGYGDYSTEVNITDETDNKIIANIQGPNISFKDPLHIVELNLQIRNLVFQKEGNYKVNFLCNNEGIGGIKFIVVKSK